jgi:hypothetical protein
VSNTTGAARTLATQCGAVFGQRLSVDLPIRCRTRRDPAPSPPTSSTLTKLRVLTRAHASVHA